ncbi:uncharacterized protein LOC129323199 [Prosopis cineraria]|uniref:uncharacterized protein LOC129323199 n=1 Tax=Prosopis cineraria TaxID=364024 RepID=UPI0024102726|nr:uncharacterized protein LOC129323199 [Prosopis cineraria]
MIPSEMRRVNGDYRPVNNTLDTVTAAATAIAAAGNHFHQPSVQKKRWGSCLSISLCFGFSKTRKRIGHAVLVPETTPAAAGSGGGSTATTAAHSTQPISVALPFVAPPSSPASFLQSEPPSTMQSPVGTVSFTPVSASMYSPSGPASIFATGPYAHETQLVSPPVFSTFTTEPSTAPFTPPPESVHLTTPSSPEVPFAQLLDPNLRNGETFQRFQISNYDFHSYQLHPGSPIGQLISPRSGISASGTSSPFPDSELTAGGLHILDFQTGDPSKLLNFDKFSPSENKRSHQGSGSLTPDATRSTTQDCFLAQHRVSERKMSPGLPSRGSNRQNVNQRVSFELAAQELWRCLENKPVVLTRAVSKSKNDAEREEKNENSRETGSGGKVLVAETANDAQEKVTGNGDGDMVNQIPPSLTLSSAKEFNFDNADGGDSHAPNIVADWWANEKVMAKEGEPSKNWSFFPMIQPGVS